jgi:hypothetical protein
MAADHACGGAGVAIGSIELANELKTLRKGRGLQAPRLAEQVGPLLRELCGLGSTQNSAAIRDRLSNRLRILAEKLPDDLRLAVTVALALHPDTRHQFLQDRVQFLANLQRRDVRTIRRRMDDGFQLLAEIALRPAGASGATGLDWYVESADTVVRLDTPAPESFERRTIVAERDGLDRIQALTRGTEPPEVYFGATLLGTEQRPERGLTIELGLPNPLRSGQRHEFGIVAATATDHYVVVPDRRCDEFRLRIRFATDRPPTKVWRITDALQRELGDDNHADGLPLPVDPAGEVALTFTGLLPHHGYGARWRTN